ncbi:GspE/PulE family protein [Oceanivirga miroungae]|uniref:General secretion pathway protein E n=1 Tax=Oceanivirga miroungae TaxID=1130046 RepID=A0A6I8M669_9FUSO|nr:ATPase, T2SS/T4P/T4SS family [Oceanivirga miroungae]VWL84922.1 general secretion pathway protein E [Oceanivirga miroungae]
MNIIDIVNSIIDEAILKKASDIHISDKEGVCHISYRIAGLLEKQDDNEYNVLQIIARIKILAKMNVAEKRLPQDGRISYKNYDLRVSSMPSILGEFIVIRILNSLLEDTNLISLGYSHEDEIIIKKALLKKNGLILICGPTGSGKTTTLLSLTKMIESHRKIISIEDPVENKLDSISQIEVNEDIGLSFNKILRSVLRLDPDVIILSEIRDEITASIAIRASLTGHLVISTLHTNDTISAFNRLIDMGIKKYLLLDSIILISAQKLLTKIDNKKIKNRLLVKEILPFDDEIKSIFKNNTHKIDIIKNLKKLNFKEMEEDLIEKYNSL